MSTVFLTGATGFIGQAVTQAILICLKPDDRLLLLVRKPFECADPRIVTLAGDLASLEKVADHVRTADFIIHMAGEARLSGGYDYNGINTVPTQKLVDIAREGNSLQRFIFVSSIAAMDRSASDLCKTPLTVASPCFPRTEYGKSKRMAEDAIVRSTLPYTIFRPGFVYGRGMRDDSHLRRFARIIRSGFPLHWLGFPGSISLIHVDDLASAIARCLTGGLGRNRTYLAETEVMSLGEALSLLGKSLTGRQAHQIHSPRFKSVLQRWHSKVPMIVAGMFLDYFWMDDPSFRNDFIYGHQPRSLRDSVSDITSFIMD